MHLFYLSSKICVAGHIFARISIVLHKNKENKPYKDMCIPHRTLYLTKQNCDGSYLRKHIPILQSN
jgi:hypothetical protein